MKYSYENTLCLLLNSRTESFRTMADEPSSSYNAVSPDAIPGLIAWLAK